MNDRYFPKEKINYKRIATTTASIALPILALLLFLVISRSLSLDTIVRIRVILRYGAASISVIGVVVLLYYFVGIFIKHNASRILIAIVIILLSIVIRTTIRRSSNVVRMEEGKMYVNPTTR